MTITKEEFQSYETVRESGVTNMFDVRMVEDLSDLPREKILYIMENYSDMKDELGKAHE